MNFAFLNKIREHELAAAGSHFSQSPGRLLEIGAGTGSLSAVLAARGFEVSAIEIAGSIYENEQVFPVSVYNGVDLPFADASFDIIFSSHVLVHIPKLDAFQREILRVLKPGGHVVHILPTTAWRFWTCLVHYPASYARHGLQAWKKLLGNNHLHISAPQHTSPMTEPQRGRSARFAARALQKLLKPLTPPARISERGNALSEHFFFSEYCWKQLFRSNGQVVEACLPSRLFYTGHLSLAPHLEMRARKVLSYLLGSAGKIYVLRPSKQK